ncbi:MAG: MBOAT family protein, partial [Lachnospiraceae bacterium]|nr:MBOAT family protein [Lachnospiraceae bacterium]
MVFSSLIFLWIFLPLVFFGNLLAGRKLSNLFLLLASLFFYAWGEPVMVLLMFACCLINWATGLLISRSSHKKASLALGVTVDLSFLFFYKYTGFFCDIVNSVSGGTLLPRLEIALPIGISFFTFQAISYLADVYRGQVQASKDPLPVALYIAFFPQLIAGPIVQYRSVEAALKERRVTAADTADGFRRFVYGLSKKVLIANVLAGCADNAFALEALDMRSAWIGALAYTLQIYYD